MHFFILFLLVAAVSFVIYDAVDWRPKHREGLHDEVKRWWAVEDPDGTRHYDGEILCTHRIRISARDGSPVNELVEHGFDLFAGRPKEKKLHDIPEGSVFKTNPVLSVITSPIWNIVTTEVLPQASAEDIEGIRDLFREEMRRRCNGKIATYPPDSRYILEIL